MKRLALVLFALAACGDNLQPPLQYTDPAPHTGKLRLVRNPRISTKYVVLDLVVGDAPLTGYSVGFDLPLDDTRVTLGDFTPSTALDPGTDPVAAKAVMPQQGPLAHMLVTGLSQKAAGAGAATTDKDLKPGARLYSIQLDLVANAPAGIVFDGTASGFVLPSGGMRDRMGNAVVAPADVAIGKLEVTH
ncbi:MAG: hypothetical protein JO257_03275 [Deltaproteobacteria bacterium]|nr:hypothetical protein [Deltaproteobacteria bacterium]